MMDRIRQMPWVAVLVAVPLVVLLAVAVTPRRQPAPKPAPAARVPGNEPTISLFVAETGQKKRIKMEEYVAGVVAGEMKPDWPREALAAQAILARTFTLKKMEKGQTRHGTDASTDVKEFQAYAPQKVNDRIREAVRATRGKVITYQGRPVRAYFHSCAGGMTATAAEGLGFTEEPTPYLKVVRDTPCAAAAEERWSAAFTRQEVLAALRKMGQQATDFASVRVADRGPSGRATRLAFGGTVVSAPALRVALGPDRMRSTLLTSLRLQGNQVLMRGRGWGHGVGMSQWGAFDKANKGWDAERILRYYYSDVRIDKRWD